MIRPFADQTTKQRIMAAQWRPANSSDDDDDDLIPTPISTKDLLDKIRLEATPIPVKVETQKNERSSSLSPVRVPETPTNNPSLLPRTTSTDSILELLRSSGISSEIRDSRTVQWRQQRYVPNPNQPAGFLVSGTKALYLQDEYFVFRDSEGQLLRPSTIPSPMVAVPSSSIAKSSESGIDVGPIDNTPEIAEIAQPISKPTKPSKSDVPKKPKEKKDTKGKKPKRTAWKKIPIDVSSVGNVVPGPPEEKRSSMPIRLC